MKVHVLATCRKIELLPATLLVFNSIRTGFPTADILVYDNANEPEALRQVGLATEKVGARFIGLRDRIVHSRWIQSLVNSPSSTEGFWICDTDVIFWDNVEPFEFLNPLAGRLIPQFYDEFTKSVTRARLHTCLMRFDPVSVRKALADYRKKFPASPFGEYDPSPFDPIRLPRHGFACSVAALSSRCGDRATFYDTCGLLYDIISPYTNPFLPDVLNCFDHLHAGTYSDVLGPHMTLAHGIEETHRRIFENPKLLKGAWRQQEKYYEHFKL